MRAVTKFGTLFSHSCWASLLFLTDAGIDSDHCCMAVSGLVFGSSEGWTGVLIPSMDWGPGFILFLVLCAAQMVSGVWWATYILEFSSVPNIPFFVLLIGLVFFPVFVPFDRLYRVYS